MLLSYCNKPDASVTDIKLITSFIEKADPSLTILRNLAKNIPKDMVEYFPELLKTVIALFSYDPLYDESAAEQVVEEGWGDEEI